MKCVVMLVMLGALEMACASIASNTRAETLGEGNIEGGVEPGVWLVRPLAHDETNPSLSLPSAAGSIRVGINDRFDLGFKLGSQVTEINAKLKLSNVQSKVVVISLAPSVGFFSLGIAQLTANIGVAFLNVALPVLVGFKLGPHELTFGPRINNVLFVEQSTSNALAIGTAGYVMIPGLSVGFAARIAEHLELMPEVAVAVPVLKAGTVNPTGVVNVASDVARGQSVMVTAVVGFKFGKLAPRAQ